MSITLATSLQFIFVLLILIALSLLLHSFHFIPLPCQFVLPVEIILSFAIENDPL